MKTEFQPHDAVHPVDEYHQREVSPWFAPPEESRFQLLLREVDDIIAKNVETLAKWKADRGI